MDATQTEVWRPVVGWDHLYEVSDQGRVRSLDRVGLSRWGTPRLFRGRILRPSGDRYQHVVLCESQNKTYVDVHRLVLESFVGPCPEGMECCHNDGDKTNNRLDNLRWDTKHANMRDTVTHGTHRNAQKSHCPQCGRLYDTLWKSGRKQLNVRRCRTCYNTRRRANYAKTGRR